MLSFTIAHAALIRLRLTQPDFPRPYRGPGNVQWRGRDVPLFALVGGTATAGAFLATVVLYPFADRLIDRFEDADVRFR